MNIGISRPLDTNVRAPESGEREEEVKVINVVCLEGIAVILLGEVDLGAVAQEADARCSPLSVNEWL
jgi:hypothetical protein